MTDLSQNHDISTDQRTSVFSAVFSCRGPTVVDVQRSLYSSDISVTKCFVDDKPINIGNRLSMDDSYSDSKTCLTNIGADSRIAENLQILLNIIEGDDSFNSGMEIDLLHDTIEKLTQASECYSN